jgi:hypothetical protein
VVVQGSSIDLDVKCEFVNSHLMVKWHGRKKNFTNDCGILPFEHHGYKLQPSFCHVFKMQKISDLIDTYCCVESDIW